MIENKTAKTSADGGTGFNYFRASAITVLRQPLETKQNTAVKPAKQWVGLTDEEIQDLSYLSQKIDEGNAAWFDRWGFARAIEQALKEKNHG